MIDKITPLPITNTPINIRLRKKKYKYISSKYLTLLVTLFFKKRVNNKAHKIVKKGPKSIYNAPTNVKNPVP